MTSARTRISGAAALALAASACASILGLDKDYETQSSSIGAGGDPGSDPFQPGGASGGRSGSASGGSPSGTSGGTSSGTSGKPSGGTSADVPPGASGNQSGDPPSNPAGGAAGAGSDGPVVTPDGGSGGRPESPPGVRVLSGRTTLGTGNASQRVALDGLDGAHSFIVFGNAFDSTSASLSAVSAQLIDGPAAEFRRTSSKASAPAIPISYYVAEFPSGVSVQRGSTRLEQAVTKIQLAQAVDLAKSFPLVTYRNEGTTYGLDDHVRAKLTGTRELTLEMYQASGTGIAEWQVISSETSNVQTGEIAVASGASQVASSLASSVDPKKTWLLLSYQVANINEGAAELMLRGHVEPTQVVVERDGSGATATVSYYAVSFSDATSVRHGSAMLAGGEQKTTVTVSDVDWTRSLPVAVGNYAQCGSTSYVTANNPGMSCYAFTLEQGALVASRGASSAAAAFDWSVIQFP